MATVGYVTTSNFGGKLSLDVGSLRTVSARLHRIRDAASALASTATTSYALLEGGDFGAAAGQGTAYFTALNGLCLALDNGAILSGVDQLDKGA